MRRLTIIGLKNGWQPIWNEKKDVVCISNGEIYNYKQLKNTLELKGHHFSTDSDIEVIVHLYEEYGEKFVTYLNGMFAIAIYDINKDAVFLYRDRLGKKPLFYIQTDNGFYFASEIKSILQCDEIKVQLSVSALDHLLTFNYLPDAMTIFEGISKLMPGEYIVIQNGKTRFYKYWKLIDFVGTNIVSEHEIISNLDNLLEESIEMRLQSDVPIGAFLSGGIDSSLVVAYISKIYKGIDTFSIGFSEKKYNELPYAREVSTLFATTHHEEIVNADFFELLPKTIWLNDNPHGDVSFLPTFILSQMTAKYVKTVLTGDGGDELFAGYEKYLPYVSDSSMTEEDFYEKTSVFTKKEKAKLYSNKLRKLTKEDNCLDLINSLIAPLKDSCPDRLNRLLYLEIYLLLEGNNLVKPDRMGMGNSIEARMPLLDYRIVEYIMGIAGKYKIKDGETKYILKLLAEKKLPANIVHRKKQMFTVPIGEWMRNELKEVFYNILLSKQAIERNLFNPQYIKYMLDSHMSGKRNYTRQLRLLVIIEMWHRIYVDKDIISY